MYGRFRNGLHGLALGTGGHDVQRGTEKDSPDNKTHQPFLFHTALNVNIE
jgi:hypothetical protein